MIEEHLTEAQIQELALSEGESWPGLMTHMQNCPRCASRVAEYHALFNSISSLEKPALGFDVQMLVMSQLPVPELGRAGVAIPKLLVLLIAGFVAFTLYLFRVNLYNLVSPLSVYAILLIAIASLLLIGIKAFGMIQKHQQKIETLNFN